MSSLFFLSTILLVSLLRIFWVTLTAVAWLPDPLPRDVTISDQSLMVVSEEGNRAVPLRIFAYNHGASSTQQQKRPLLVYFHGGGGCLGDVTQTHHPLLVTLASQLQCTVVAVDYRLAPEHTFPAAHCDAIASVEQIVAVAAQQDIEEEDDAYPSYLSNSNGQIVVGGDSFGANLALVAAIRSATVAGMVLLIPFVERPDAGYESYNEWWRIISPSLLRFFWWVYLDGRSIPKFIDTHSPTDVQLVFPLQTDPALLQANAPPAFVATAGRDVLRDEGMALADRLQSSGVNVSRHHFPRANHLSIAHSGAAHNTDHVECLRRLRLWFDALTATE